METHIMQHNIFHLNTESDKMSHAFYFTYNVALKRK